MKILEGNYKNVDYVLEDDEGRIIVLYSVDWNGEIYTKGYYINLDQLNDEYIYFDDKTENHLSNYGYRPIYKRINDDYYITNFEEI